MAKNEKEGEVKVKGRVLSKEEVKEYLELFLDLCKCSVEGKNGEELMTKEDKQKIAEFSTHIWCLVSTMDNLYVYSKKDQKEVVGMAKHVLSVYFGLFSKKESHQYLYGALEKGLKSKDHLSDLRLFFSCMVLAPHALVSILMPEDSICKEKESHLDEFIPQFASDRKLSLEELSNILKQCKDAFPVSYNKSILKKLPA